MCRFESRRWGLDTARLGYLHNRPRARQARRIEEQCVLANQLATGRMQVHEQRHHGLRELLSRAHVEHRSALRVTTDLQCCSVEERGALEVVFLKELIAGTRRSHPAQLRIEESDQLNLCHERLMQGRFDMDVPETEGIRGRWHRQGER